MKCGRRRRHQECPSKVHGVAKLKPASTLLALVEAPQKAQPSVLVLRFAHEQLALLTCLVVVIVIVQRIRKCLAQENTCHKVCHLEVS